MSRPRVVILGGGFAGLYAARELGGAPVDVTLVDQRNHHLFQPLLYQVATAALNPADIASPIRAIVRQQSNVTVLLAEARSVDRAARRVELDDGTLDYDYLFVATGATHSYFGHPEWEALAPGLKTIEDALEIRRRIFIAYEEAEREEDAQRRGARLTFVVVGGGPTGVELAGALAEIARHALRRDFRRIEPEAARVVLIEGEPRVLPQLPPALSASAERQLTALGVEVRTRARVSQIDGAGVTLSDGERIDASTVLWGAGVAASPLGRTLGAPVDRAGRVEVRPDLRLPGDERVFVLGDLASARSTDGAVVPGLAPAAMQMGRHAARNLLRLLDAHAELAPGAAAGGGDGVTLPFRYRDKGSLATIGRGAAVGMLGALRLSGFVAWAAWLFVHILYLAGFRNRVLVVIEWAWSYLTYRRGARLITGGHAPRRALPPPHDPPVPSSPPKA